MITADRPEIRAIGQLVFDFTLEQRARLHQLWLQRGQGGELDDISQLLQDFVDLGGELDLDQAESQLFAGGLLQKPNL